MLSILSSQHIGPVLEVIPFIIAPLTTALDTSIQINSTVHDVECSPYQPGVEALRTDECGHAINYFFEKHPEDEYGFTTNKTKAEQPGYIILPGSCGYGNCHLTMDLISLLSDEIQIKMFDLRMIMFEVITKCVNVPGVDGGTALLGSLGVGGLVGRLHHEASRPLGNAEAVRGSVE
ncbi:MAG: hypothetical protein Q9164_007314, partial [Protoblastenia rupestris]